MTPPSPLATPPGWRMWLIWSVGVSAYVLSVANRTSLAAVGVEAAVHFSADASTLSLFAVLQLGVYGLMQIPVGVLLDRYGSRPVMAAGMVLIALGQLLLAFAPNVGLAIVARMILGAGDAAIFPGVVRVISIWFPAQRSPMMIQLTGLIGYLGQILSLMPLAALMRATGWSAAFATIAGISGLFAVLIVAIIRNRPPERRDDPVDLSIDTDTGAIRVVRSAGDFRFSLREAWAQPGTRLAFWSHFTPPFAGMAFIMLWGVPFLTAGEGLSMPTASLVTTVFVVVGMLVSPVLGALSARYPMQRSRLLVLPIVLAQMAAWLAVIVWPGQAPLWLLIVMVVTISVGGPASLISFDHARTFNPEHRLSTVTGLVNGAGFVAALIAIFLIGLALDLQGAGAPETYTLDAFRIAFLTQFPLWLLGLGMMVRERRLTRRALGLR